ncbi:hypothetical protein GVN16_20695 [Emticicia sp. CRIBPO]|uniref:hypothetical protein n=1 Tax=Emticicia sp. CRIBPO TaxID=2683258 RepID=UPI001411F69D|nr:hypothetical protein [Emticicia sp. CRIBPO]NBA88204.1 hypothetical protein [Emticicia sp. CRIBPO]
MRRYGIHPKALLFFIFSAVALASCYKEPNFALKPEIEYNSIKKDIRIDQFFGGYKDSVVVSVKFQDGDGDLGLNDAEIAEAIKVNNFNYVIKYHRRVNGKYVEYIPLEPLSGFFPRLKNDGKDGPIEGVLSYTMQFLHAFTPKKDSVKFEISIKDRAGNISNSVETDMIILNQF